MSAKHKDRVEESENFEVRTLEISPTPNPIHLSLVKNNIDDIRDIVRNDQPKHGGLLSRSDDIFESLKTIALNVGVSNADAINFATESQKKLGFYLNKLPDRPAREYRRGENVIEYIRADDGLGPWVKAGKLSRPLIIDIAPGAHIALLHYLRRHELPDDLHISTKSEIVASEQSEILPEDIKAARRLLSRVQRERQQGRER